MTQLRAKTLVPFRSGEAMEKALQDCCRSMRIGKILVDSDSDTHEAHVVFAKFPDDIANRKVGILMNVKALPKVLEFLTSVFLKCLIYVRYFSRFYCSTQS